MNLLTRDPRRPAVPAPPGPQARATPGPRAAAPGHRPPRRAAPGPHVAVPRPPVPASLAGLALPAVLSVLVLSPGLAADDPLDLPASGKTAGKMRCTDCDGSGKTPCETCGGAGEIRRPCPLCKGSGRKPC